MEKLRELFGIRVAAARLIFAVGIEELVMEMKKKYNMAIVTHNMQQATRIWDSAAFFFPGEMAGFGVAGRVFSMPRDQRRLQHREIWIMMRNKFDHQMQVLNNDLIEMGALIEAAIASSIKALKEQDTELAKKVVAEDQTVNQKERDIEAMCLRLLLQQQPVARDLRLISAALKMITDMERIGDQAADIAEISVFLADRPHISELIDIPRMGEATALMVTQAIDAFVEKNLDLALAVIAYDDVVDNLFTQIKKELIDLIRDNKDAAEQALDLMMITKYLERIGDHAVNVAEWVVFSITGQHVKGKVKVGE